MTGQHDNGTEREGQLHQILLTYLKALETGQSPDRRELLNTHPEFASELAEFFASHDQVDQWAAPLLLVGQSVSVATPPPEETPSLGVEAEGFEARARAGTFGDYELLEEIGAGGMGVVYKARQKSLHRLVALKMIRAGGLACRADVQRFRTEAEAAASLDHPHIVPIYDVGELEGQPYFTMKLVTGHRLAEQLPRFLTDPRASARLLIAVAQAVHHAHQRGILHRDLKPSNILLDAEGRPHVTDFGLAKRLEVDSSLTQSGLLVGTPSYMAPEQATAQRGAITTATDVYGLGAVMYVLLTGCPPFRGDSVLDTLEQVKQREPEPPSASNRLVDRDLETICLKCLQKEPRDRYVSALALAEDLEHWLAGEPIMARPISRRERFWRWCRRNPTLSILSAAVVRRPSCTGELRNKSGKRDWTRKRRRALLN
jgi:serine/threonine-protein kinase